jgi:hypothetical protein
MRRLELVTTAAALLMLSMFPAPAASAQTAGNEIVLEFTTGGDDLRGGNDNVHVVVLLASGTQQRFDNVNGRAKWSNHSRVIVRRPLSAKVQFKDIIGVRIETTVSGGAGGDNWDLDRLTVSASIDGSTKQLFDQRGAPLFRFTGDRRLRDFRFSTAPLPTAAPVRTRFDPTVHGFKFHNRFKNIFISELDWYTTGLCGGMSYSALDYFLARRPVPQQEYMPAEGMPLQSYIYNRQVTSITQNLDKWGEYGFNPGGSRNREFFRWGLQVGSGRLGELRARIDRGQPVPLGLQSCGADCGCRSGCPGSHQVLAIGYAMGRYTGDEVTNVEDLSILIYDPNAPGTTRTLKPNVAGAYYSYVEEPNKRWRAYFVDTKYAAQANPPVISDSPNELIATFITGGDDLRGGNDNVHLVLLLRAGTPLRFPNVNGGHRWINNSSQTVAVPLPATVRFEDIAGVRLETTFGGGTGGDNWDLKRLEVSTRLSGTERRVLTREGTPLVRFTGSVRSQDFRP